MKKNLLMISATVLLLAGCQNKETPDLSGTLKVSPKAPFEWVSGDKIGVLIDGANTPVSFENGQFSIDFAEMPLPGTSYVAYYPYSATSPISDNQISFKVADKQNGTTDKGPAYGTISVGELQTSVNFKQVKAYADVKLLTSTYNDWNIRTVAIKGENVTLAGDAKVDLKDDEFSVSLMGKSDSVEVALPAPLKFGEEQTIHFETLPAVGLKDRTLTIRVVVEKGSQKEELFTTVIGESLTAGTTTTFQATFNIKEGTADNPMVIKTADQLANLYTNVLEDETTYVVLGADIDLSGVEWNPVNAFALDFDGQNHTISNLTCVDKTKGSFAGPLYGEIRNVKFVNPVITGANNLGVVAGNVGSSSGTKQGKVSGVTVTGAKITSSSGKTIGGICGYIGDGSVSNCSFDGDITGASSLGGIVGYVYINSEIVSCTTSGTITPDGSNAYPCVGGIEATGTGTLLIRDCSSSMVITNPGTSAGGIFGQTNDNANLTIEGCTFSGTVMNTNTASGKGDYAGGILAYARNTSSVTISRCSVTKDAYVFAGSRRAGGILAYNNSVDSQKVTISDCSVSGTIEAGGGGMVGGIVGEAGKNLTVSNCYVDGTIKATWVSGGVVGLATNGNAGTNAAAVATTGMNIVVENCLFWADEMVSRDGALRHTSKGMSDGVIVGYSNVSNTLKGCWRNPSLHFVWYGTSHLGKEADDKANALTDQEDADADHPLANFPQGGVNDRAYNGKAATGETASAVAKRIGWSADVWNLSGATPVLK